LAESENHSIEGRARPECTVPPCLSYDAFVISRREFLWSAAASTVMASATGRGQSVETATSMFRHGVASGDPLVARVVLWTRVSPSGPLPRSIDVRWRIADDPEFRRTVRRGTTTTSADRDFTVKVDADGLSAGRTYYYAFEVAGQRSPVGRTRTLPAATARVRLG